MLMAVAAMAASCTGGKQAKISGIDLSYLDTTVSPATAVIIPNTLFISKLLFLFKICKSDNLLSFCANRQVWRMAKELWSAYRH